MGLHAVQRAKTVALLSYLRYKGKHFGAQPEINKNASRLYSLAAREVLAGLELNVPWTTSLAELLLYLDNDHSKVERLFCMMLARRDQWLPYVMQIKDHDEQRKMLENGLQQVIFETHDRLTKLIPSHLVNEIIVLLTFASQQLTLLNPASSTIDWQQYSC